jgi:PPOX class probable FMN-dependent enzyme
MTVLSGLVEVTSAEELVELVGGEPAPGPAGKVRTALEDEHRQWLATSPFCLVATADAEGNCDVSPKGDPPGFARVLDDTTVAIPDRPGNRRTDGFRNILANPHVGLIFLVPGRGDTLRINGRARLVRDAPFFDEMVVKGHRPRLALVVEIDQIFFHCAKAFMRAKLWRPETWDPEALPSRARIVQGVERPDDPIEVLEKHYGPEYAKGLYAG